MANQAEAWIPQSPTTDPGRAASCLDPLPDDPGGLRRVSQQLVAHYFEATAGEITGLSERRSGDVDCRYAEAMFERVLGRGPADLQRARPSGERLLGCCRDFTVFFVSMARHKGIPARPRVGYASYFRPGWLIDHVIAEVWTEGRWRLIEPEIADEFARDADGGGFDPLDVPSSRFLPGPAAWRAARAGRLDPERFVVAPEVAEPYTRGWLSLRHHLVQDLAALTRTEMLLWDQWGILERPDVLRDAGMLDELALATGDPRSPLAQLELWSGRDGLKVPRRVTSYSPAHPGPVAVDVGRALGAAG